MRLPANINATKYRRLMPSHTPEEFAALETAICIANCILDPIILDEDLCILDGFARYDIYKKHKIKNVTCKIVKGLSEDQKLYLILSKNCSRRHLARRKKLELILQEFRPGSSSAPKLVNVPGSSPVVMPENSQGSKGLTLPEVLQDYLEEWINLLRPAEIIVSRRYQFAPLGNLFPGQCFKKAADYVLLAITLGVAKDMLLVHGESVNGVHGPHAWVELPGDILFDGVLQRFYDLSQYYALDGTRAWYKYTADATNYLDENIRKHSRNLQWHSTLGLPWADYENPTIIDYACAVHYWGAVREKQVQSTK